jgi:hypothetical protein
VPRRVLTALRRLLGAPAALLRRFGVRTRLRRDRLGMLAHASLLVAGLGIGLLLALPVDDVHDRCPPSGQGYGWCALQKAWLPTVLIVLGALLAAHLVAALLLVRVPAVWARLRQGERPVRMTRAQEEPPYNKDPFLLAATWGVKRGREDVRRSLLQRLLRR